MEPCSSHKRNTNQRILVWFYFITFRFALNIKPETPQTRELHKRIPYQVCRKIYFFVFCWRNSKQKNWRRRNIRLFINRIYIVKQSMYILLVDWMDGWLDGYKTMCIIWNLIYILYMTSQSVEVNAKYYYVYI